MRDGNGVEVNKAINMPTHTDTQPSLPSVHGHLPADLLTAVNLDKDEKRDDV